MRYLFLKYTLAGLLLLTVFVACKKEYATIEEEDNTAITKYLQENNLNGLMTQYGNTGIYYQIITPGTGSDLKYTEVVPLIFTTKSLDNSFSSLDTFSKSQRFGVTDQFLGYFKPDSLRSVIKNTLKKRGGKIRVILPSRFAYGVNGNGSVPGNASLDYIINVLDETKIPMYDDISIQKFLQANNLTGFTKTASGLYYKISEPGTGASITEDSTITAEYQGKLLNGVVFDPDPKSATKISLLTSRLGELSVRGWIEGIPLIKEGGAIRLIIPSYLSYGIFGYVVNGNVVIPTSSCLDFDIKVTAVTP